MKQFFFAFLLLAMSSSFPVILALAEETAAPQVDEPLSPVDANKAILTGEADPGAMIMVVGGRYEIPTATADAQGKFSVEVALVQESSNTFYITAATAGADPSESIEVVIVEGAEVTQAYEASTGEDHTAPDAPDLEETDVETTDSTYTIEGSGEAKGHVLVNGEDSEETVDSDGSFSVEVELTGDGEKDTFSISIQDKAGNVSSGVKVYVTGGGEADESSTEEDKEPLTDIESHWAKDYINQLYNDDVISGYGDGRFGPDDKITRAQIVKIALLGFDHPLGIEEISSFSDVDRSGWYIDYVDTAAASLGIVTGYSDNTFRPNNEVTRAEALKIILVAGGISDFPSVVPNFSDVDTVADWFAKYTAYAKSSGLIGGYTDGTFRGNQSITRAEVCKIVVELME
ncbi:MAG: S-layer homology domain-containing protein [Patescibacteria group bacterium]